MKQYFMITIILAAFLYSVVVFKPIFIFSRDEFKKLVELHSRRLQLSKSKCPSIYSDTISVEEYIKGPLLQNDPRVLRYIEEKGIIQPPPSPDKAYNLRKPNRDPSMGQSQIVKKIFRGKKNGFFVECGALDGETRSNTLALERDFGWEGLLIEADPETFKMLLKKNRKAWAASCCLAVNYFPHEVIFKRRFNRGKIQEEFAPKGNQSTSGTKVQCFPLFSLLSAMGVKTVDFFSLDVEGFELGVLSTIPFDLINISVITVEFTHGKGGAGSLMDFMKTKGYRVVTKLTHHNNLANDIIFAKSNFPIHQTFPATIKSENMTLNSNVAFTPT